MDSLQTEDGQFFIRSLAQFIRQHERALANSLQLTVHRRQPLQNTTSKSSQSCASSNATSTGGSAANSLASALSFAGLNFMSSSVKAAYLTLTPHHLFYLLSRIEELGITVGPMNVRIESIHSDLSQSNYVSFLQSHKIPRKGRSDADSIHSVSSVRSVMSGMSSFWSSIGLGPSQSKTEKARAAIEADLKYLYSAFTKLPSLRLTADPRARLIQGYEEFPFDTAVPLFAFKNLQQLDIVDMDFRQFHGWDRLAEQLCLLTVKRGNLDDPADLLNDIVLDDAERRRRRINRHAPEFPSTPSWTAPPTPSTPYIDYVHSHSDPGSPGEEVAPATSPETEEQVYINHKSKGNMQSTSGNISPKRPNPNRPGTSYRHTRTYSSKIKRSGSGSSNSSDYSPTPQRRDSIHNVLGSNTLPSSKWQRLKYLSLADNALTSISASSIAPLTSSLRSLNLSSNLFAEIPDSLASLMRLTSLDLSNCMIESLHSLSRSPLPAITTIKLKSNRLKSLAGVERLVSLENLHVQDNQIADPMEAARLTGMPNIRKIWIKHNPLTKKQDYRVKIMNLFRQTPGYLDDIIIDDQLPTYAERKLLLVRVPEVERQALNVQGQSSERPLVVQATLPIKQQEQGNDIPRPSLTRQESTRRRKTTHRRIVDLAAKEVVPAISQASVISEASDFAEVATPNAIESTTVSEQKEDILRPDVQPALSDTSELDLGPSESGESLATLQDQQDDEYRAKVEALRQQFGANWLNALGEQHWHADHHFANEIEQGHSKLHFIGSPVIMTGGRSLG